MKKVALLGAAGAVGKSVAGALGRAGIPYRVIGRSAASLTAAFGADPLAEVRTWNPDDPASVRQALSGVDAAVYLVGVDYWKFQLHPVLMKAAIDGAEAAGVERMLLVGTVYPFGRPQTNPVTEDHPRQPHTFKGRMRMQQEDLLFEAHAKGRLKATELRLPDFYGPGVDKSFLWSAFVAAAQGGRAQLVGPIDKPHQFVFIPDVGPPVVRMLANDAAFGRAWNFAGSGTATQRELAERIFAQAGRKPSWMVAGKTVLRLAGLFNPMLREMVEMHNLVTNPVLMDDSRLSGLLGSLDRTGYEEGIRQTLAAMPKQS